MNFDLKEFTDIIRRANDQNHFEGKDGREYSVDNEGNVEPLTHDPIEAPLPDDNHYYEATYNGDKDELYIDMYCKQANRCYKNVSKSS